MTAAPADPARRLVDALAVSIAERGLRDTTVADVVRIARTSRRTFYRCFPDLESCYLELLRATTAGLVAGIDAAVDRDAPWRTQVAQAVHAWLAGCAARPEITLSWIRDAPALGAASRALQREALDAFVALLTELTRAADVPADPPGDRPGPIPRPTAVLLVGGLRELIAQQVESGRGLDELAGPAVTATEALLLTAPRPATGGAAPPAGARTGG